MRFTLAVAVACLLLGGLAAAGDATAAIRKSTDIPAQGLGPALTKLAKEFDFQVLYRTEIVSNLKSQPAVGALTSDEALGKVLTGTGLTYKYLDDKTVTIVPMSTTGSGQSTPANLSGSSDEANTSKEAGKKTSQDFRVAQVDQGKSSGAVSVGEQGSTSQEKKPSLGLEEIVVTAQKRPERLMDVPVSLNVLTDETLQSLGVKSLSDLADYVPGMAIEQAGSPGHTQIVMRGISSGYNGAGVAPTVATLINDIPLGATNAGAGTGGVSVDVAPLDVERVEVLKGPQGTLYGANAMGGLIKYVLRAPSLSEFDASVSGDLHDVDHSGGIAAGGRGSVSIPIVTDALAVRFSGYYEHAPGYTDNVGTGIDHANSLTREGGRGTVLWQPLSNLRVEATFLDQQFNQNDATGVSVDATTLKPIYGPRSRFTNLPEPFYSRIQLAYVTANWDLGFATLTSSTSWSTHYSAIGFDIGQSLNQCCDPANPNGFSFYQIHDNTTKDTEELRLASRADQRVTWMLGTYGTKEDSYERFSLDSYFPDKSLQLPVGYFLTGFPPIFFKEWAAFGDVTYKITDQLDLAGGARYASNTESTCKDVSGGLFGTGSAPCTHRPYQGKATWMGTVSFHLDADAMLYARVATGYRPGGGCTGCGNPTLGSPDFYYPDTVVNYEGGLKGQFFNKRVQLDASVFHIDWKNMQITALTPQGGNYTGNVGGASSSGVELSAGFRPTNMLQISMTVGYTDAHLTTPAPLAGGAVGDPLSEAPRWTASIITDYTRPFGARNAFLLGGDYRYKDVTYNGFRSSTDPNNPALPMGPQNLFGLYTGVRLNQTTLKLYASNVFNNRSYTGLLYLAQTTTPALNPVQPRTIGVALNHQF